MCSAKSLFITPVEISWRDGTPFSSAFGDCYFSRDSGIDESEYVFLQNNRLPARWLQSTGFTIAETGFGTGLNFLVTLKRWHETAPPGAHLHFISVEKFPLTRADLQSVHSLWPDLQRYSVELLQEYPEPVYGYHRLEFHKWRVTLTLMLGDVLDMYRNLEARVDAWFLDGFAPAKNRVMWSRDLFGQIARLSHDGTTFSTFTSAGVVRRGLASCGFAVSKVAGFGRKREMLCGVFQGNAAYHDLTPWFRPPAPVSAGCRCATVVGAGIAGVTTAYMLAQRGWRVTLIERHADVAQGASGNLLGVVMPRLGVDGGLDSRFYLAAFLAAVKWFAKLKMLYPEEVVWQDSGVLQLLAASKAERFCDLGLPDSLVQIVSRDRGVRLCGVDVRSGGLFYPHGGSLDPGSLCRALVNSEPDMIRRCFHRTALSIEKSGDLWSVNDSRAVLSRDPVVVLANGYEVTSFAQGAELPVFQVRGQLCHLPESGRSGLLRMPVCYDGYVMPLYKKYHVAGASYSRVDKTMELQDRDRLEIVAALSKAVPGLGYDGGRFGAGRVGFRASSRDYMPLVGPLADRELLCGDYADLHHGRRPDSYPPARYLPGLFVNVAHGSRGLVSSVLSAMIIAAYLDGEPQPLPRALLDRLHPSRFWINHLKKRCGESR